jgi:hypothetical protein
MATSTSRTCAPKKASFSCWLFLDGACADQPDRPSKLAFVRLETKATRMIACQFLRDLIEVFPYRLRTILTGNGVQFCHPPRYRDGPTATFAGHLFDRLCAEHKIGHRLTKLNHPWSEEDQETVRGTVFPPNDQAQ